MPSQSFTTAGWHTLNVPTGVTNITVTLDGAGSGSRRGGRVTGFLAVSDKWTLHIYVGSAGRAPSGGTGGGATGGGGGAGGGGTSQTGGYSGGGATYIRVNSTTGTLKAVAGGAGGDSGDGGPGGDGGGTTGRNGRPGTAGTEEVGNATGGTQAQGGNGGTSSRGSQFNGANASDAVLAPGGAGGKAGSGVRCHGGGGGGGGYHPGGGGQASAPGYAPGGGGGGGSNYTGGLTGATNQQGAAGTGVGAVHLSWVSGTAKNQPPTPPSEPEINDKAATDGHLTKSTGSVKIDAKVNDPDSGETVRLVARVSTSTSFASYNTFRSGYVSRGKRVALTVTGLAQNTHYYARLYSQDEHGLYSQAYSTVDFWTNRAPYADSLTVNTQGSGMTLPTLDSATFSWMYHDPDVADYQTAFQIQYRVAATSVAPAGAWTTVTQYVGQNLPPKTGQTEPPSGAKNEWVFNPQTFKGNRFYEWQVRVRDSQNLWGAFGTEMFTFFVSSTSSPPVLVSPPNRTPVQVEDPTTFVWRFIDPEPGDTQKKADLRYRVLGNTKDLADNGPSETVLDVVNLATNPALESNAITGFTSSDPSLYPIAVSTLNPISGTRSALATRQAASSGQIAATNLAVNPGLSGGTLDGWNSNNGSLYPLTLDTTGAISGANSVLSTRTATTPNNTVASVYLQATGFAGTSAFPVVVGQPITVSLSVKCELAQRRIAIYWSWLDAAGATMTGQSSGQLYPVNSTQAGQVYRIAHTGVPPTGAAFARVILTVLTISGNAVTGERVWFDNLRVSTGTATLDATNYAKNPNLETGLLSNWASASASAYLLEIDGTSKMSGVYSARVTRQAANPGTAYASISLQDSANPGSGFLLPAGGGPPLTFSIDVKCEFTSRIFCQMQWFDAAGSVISSSTGNDVATNVAANTVTRVSYTETATPPANAVSARGRVIVFTANNTTALTGARCWFDRLSWGGAPYFDADMPPDGTYVYALGPGSAGASVSQRWRVTDAQQLDATYFDGDTAASTTQGYRWTGTARASTSDRFYNTTPTLFSGILSGLPTPTVPVTPYQAVTMSVDVKTEQAGRMARTLVTYQDSGGTVIGNQGWAEAMPGSVAGKVVRIHRSVTPPANAASATWTVEVLAVTGRTVVGERVWFDNLRIGGTDHAYFDGDTKPAGAYTYKWVGTPRASASQRWRRLGTTDVATLPDSGEWVTVLGDIAPGVPGSAKTWTLDPGRFVDGYTYEWQVRTYDTIGSTISDWSDSFQFYAIATPGALAGILPFTSDTVIQGELGCGSYRVFIYQQGGRIRLGEVEPVATLNFKRLRDDISSCLVLSSGYSTDCGALYASVRSWMHEIVVFRDGVRVWEGPITRITYTAKSVEFEAKDVMAYVYRRVMRQGYNDAYRLIRKGTGGQPNEYLGLMSVVKRASMILTQALAPYDPNVLPYLTTIEYPDDVLESRVVPNWSTTAFEEIDDLAATAGLDYTVVGRRILLWDTHRPIGRLPELRDGDFSESPIVTEYGMQLATFFAVTNGSGVYGSTEVAAKTVPYGPVELLASAYNDSAAASDEIQTPEALEAARKAMTEQAQRNISGRWPTPLVVRVPDNSSLSPRANLGFQQLIPGVWLPLRSVNTPRQVLQWQKLDSVEVDVDEKGEVVKVVLSPAPRGGQDPDADRAAEEATGG